MDTALLRMMERLEKPTRQRLNQIRSVSDRRRPTSPPRSYRGCWSCGALTHLRKDCPDKSPKKSAHNWSQGQGEKKEAGEASPGNDR